jgi:hypothetical protein
MRPIESIPLGAHLNLVIQLAVLILLIAGARLAKAGRLDNHGRMMKIAIVMQFASLIIWMGPSLALNITVLSTIGLGPLVTILHVIMGYAALFLAISSVLHKTIISLKWTMRATFLVWTMTAMFGVGFYVYYYLLG